MSVDSTAKGGKAAKKPITIGAALRQRMRDGDPANEGEIGKATQEDPLERAQETLVAAQAPELVEDPLESFNTRLPRSLLRRMKVHSAVHDLKIQDLVYQALQSYFATQSEL